MNEFDLERYRNAWKDEQNFGRRALGTREINDVLKKQSRTVTRQFRTGLLVDIVLKSAAVLGLVSLLFLFRDSSAVSLMNSVVLGFTLFLLFVQLKTLREVPQPHMAAETLRTGLENMIRFYRERFLRALYVAAVSGALVFYIGVLHYSWYKYGGIRPMETDDYVVFISGLLLAFAINAIAQRWQAAFHLHELEACLQEIDAESLSRQHLRKQRHRRIKVSLMWTVWVALGVLVLSYLLAR